VDANRCYFAEWGDPPGPLGPFFFPLDVNTPCRHGLDPLPHDAQRRHVDSQLLAGLEHVEVETPHLRWAASKVAGFHHALAIRVLKVLFA